MGLSHRQFQRDRDDRVVRLVGRLRYMTTHQIAQVLFSGRTRVANRRLLRLTQQGQLRRFAPVPQGPYIYHRPGTRPTRHVPEAMNIADLYAALVRTRPPGWTIQTFAPKWGHGPIRADALLVATHPVKPRLVAFIEWDSGTVAVQTVAKKCEAYLSYAQNGLYRSAPWWQPGVQPALLMITPVARAQPLRAAIPDSAARDLALRIAANDRVLADPWALLLAPALRPHAHQQQREL